jgi:ATP-dependent RNA helicase SUPV3L1/SUV3
MERSFIVHIGPTNSGKTYASVERLKTAEHGIYLGPLRLLAFEQYQKLNEQGYPCSLYTGEEHQLVPGARIQASTIEMADEFEKYDIAVIDEAQMVADKERGWAWTTAILGLRADEIHVCIAPYAEKIITDLIEECGDSYEIIRHERQTPLVMDKPKFKLFREYIHKHDALIVFSRRNVHAVAGELRAMGIRCSVIYGNLPYDVRQEEARRFRDGETDVVVATDAIGMGMNLPIERLVFLEISKFDGTNTRLLNAAEIQQIAGRAGRRGLYEKGLWNALEGKEIIASAVDLEIPQIEAVYAGFPESLITIEGKLSGIISEWRNIEPPEGYIISALEHEYELCTYLEERTDDKRLIYRLITIPFDEEDKELRLLWNRLAATVLSGNPVKLAGMMLELPYGSMSLTAAEKLYKEYDLAYAFIEKFGDKAESETILQYKKELSEIIAEILKTSKLPFKTCRYCGRKLRWNYPFGICAECYNATRVRRRHHWDEYY